MDELPEAEIERAQGVGEAHSHDGVTAEVGSLLDHLQAVHEMPVQPALSHTTQAGLHDRLHDKSKAGDDPT